MPGCLPLYCRSEDAAARAAAALMFYRAVRLEPSTRPGRGRIVARARLIESSISVRAAGGGGAPFGCLLLDPLCD